MKVNEIEGLYVGYNRTENFRILIATYDGIEKAKELADEYCNDGNFTGEFEVTEFTNVNTKFDCDYIIC